MEPPALADWVGDVDAFAAHRWQREPALFPRNDRRAAAAPFGLDELDAAFDTGLLRTPYLEMVRSDKVTIPPEDYTAARVVNGVTHHGFADRAKVLALLRRGATLLLRRVDQWHPPTGALAARLSAELDRRVESFFFVTPAGGQGLAVHRDDADVFVLQAAGRKTWYVHDAPATADWRLGELPDGERSPLRLHGVLEPGDVLYVPRGFAHRAVGAGGLSAHLSLTVRDLSVRDLATALAAQATEGLGLPARPLGDAAVAEACAALLDHARARLAALEPEELLRAARRAARAEGPADGPAESLAQAALAWPPGPRGPGAPVLGRPWHRLRAAARGRA
ncbi:JmjC domain-containing protein [Kitasatospora sp. NPDC018619]|uniref:JmjC domain-containing protein n=1 Tax=unclassified Kitasatospora TaxID=2633591 RepID=UPI0037AE9AA5